jgi:hypothetical protein
MEGEMTAREETVQVLAARPPETARCPGRQLERPKGGRGFGRKGQGFERFEGASSKRAGRGRARLRRAQQLLQPATGT